MSATPRINSLAELDRLQIRGISSKPRLYSRGILVSGKTTLINAKGEVFHSCIQERSGRTSFFNLLQPWLQGEILKSLFLLGYVSREVTEGFEKKMSARRIQNVAKEYLKFSEELANIGVPFTDEQIRKLKRIEKGEGL